MAKKTLTVLTNCVDIRRGAQFRWNDFFTSAWGGVWPVGMMLTDDDGNEYVVVEFEKGGRKHNALCNHRVRIEPRGVNGEVRIVEV